MVVLGIMLGYKMNETDDPALIIGVDREESHELAALGRVEEIVRFVESRYVEDVNDSRLVESAISAVLDQLDPHSIYIAPDQLRAINNSMEGKYNGIGIQSFYLDDTVNVISVVPDSPADKAGIIPFDQLIAIGDVQVAGAGMEFDSISQMLRNGDAVKKLTLHREGQVANLDVQLSAKELPLKSVNAAYMLNEDTGIIQIERFSSQTYKEFMEQLEELVDRQGMKHLIIDVRGNPGGYLPEATNILSQLIREKDRLLVYTEGKNNKKTEYFTTGKPFFNIDKVAILVDEHSASGSEIMAGAIQDTDRGLVIGERTFGKGLVQEQYDLTNGGAIRLTVAKYYTPSGRSIQRPYTDKEAYHNMTNVPTDSTRIDTVAYRTMLLGREVYGGGGILPDVITTDNPIEQDPAYYELSQYLPEYVYRLLKDRKMKRNMDENSVRAWALDGAQQQDLVAYLNEKGVHYAKSYLAQYKDEIEQDLERAYLDILYADVVPYKYQNQKDKDIAEALKYTQANQSLQDFLADSK